MRAVSNTSPISNLASIDRLDLLQHQFDQVLIPEGVSAELAAHPDHDANRNIQAAIRKGWIKVAKPKNSALLRALLLQLHQGEAEAIVLATELNADILLIDEQEGRRIASQVGCAVTGVLGILLRAKSDGSIPALRPEIDRLRAKARFFISKSLEARILLAAGE